jgi:hypothetical protein
MRIIWSWRESCRWGSAGKANRGSCSLQFNPVRFAAQVRQCRREYWNMDLEHRQSQGFGPRQLAQRLSRCLRI